ncbi:pleckstrin homology domain-containing family H member 3 isoform X2 [Acipenser ruthenus]|uniref:pleckstrin homology domain-containing family H member 3 isoform X2 n=1 Tax=Acipenser ruthenus TaxID=7906 RepID=UPI002741E5D2|nr:pleckstrin homology domain-containing family H member 3 isoform X2 [Acipenser ruthenus]
MPLQGFCSFLCCRHGFTVLGRDYGEKEEEESFELRSKEDEATCNGRGPLDITLTQPGRTANGPSSRSEIPEEMRSLIIEKSKGAIEEDAETVVKGWLYREVRGGWIKMRRHWFVLTQDSLDFYTSNEKNAKRLGSLVLTSLCSVIWPDKQSYKETGNWSIMVYGRKHSYRLYTKHFNEAVHWACAIQKVIDSKAPVETPTQLLIRDIEENKFNPEAVGHIYKHNPILKHTQSPLYASLLPFPYASLEHTFHSAKGYTTLRDEAVKIFNSLQQLESAQDPVSLIQGVLQTCLDLRPLRDEVYCQLVKQTSGTPSPDTPAQLRYWQLLTCMSCTFLPSLSILKYLRFHLKRVQSQYPDTEMDNYATFISEAIGKTKGREYVPSWEEILVLMNRQEMFCTIHYPGRGSCKLPIRSHTTADELLIPRARWCCVQVVKKMKERLGLQLSHNTFALFEGNTYKERAVGGSTIVADILTSLAAKEPESEHQWKLCFKLYCFLDTDSVPKDSIEFTFLFEQSHAMVIQGHLFTSEEDLQLLAALRLQSLNGDFSTHTPSPPLEELFPRHVIEARALALVKTAPAKPACCPSRFLTGALHAGLWKHTAVHKIKAEDDLRFRARLKEEGASMMASIVESWKTLQGRAREDVMSVYISVVKQWPGFGSTLYEIDFYISSTGSFSQQLWLGVAATSVSLYRQGDPEPLESIHYGQISSYGVSDSTTFKITAGDREFLFETSKLNEIAQLMTAYITSAHRTQRPSRRTGSKNFALGSPVQELSSHPV